MTESKIVVPEKMLKAASAAMRGPITNLSDFLEAALRWLSENPIVPTREQMRSISDAVNREFADADTEMIECMEDLCIEWQRRMFLAPEVPDGCVDDIHEVTEREWQKLMDTIHDLETSLKEK